MRVQILGSVPTIERPRRRVLWIDIHANASCLTPLEPRRERPQQITRHPGAASFRDDIQPFQLSVATEAPREMSRDETDNVLPVLGDEHHPRRQRLLRMQLTSHVPADAVVPILLGAPHRGTNTSEPPDISESALPDH